MLHLSARACQLSQSKSRLTVILAMWFAVVLSATPVPAVQISGLFGDHMVLQRDKPIRVWGSGDAGESIQLELAGKPASATANADGKWSLELSAMKAGGPVDMTITGKNKVAIKDILIGDIWLCSGQSNIGTGFDRRPPPLDPGEMNLPKLRYLDIPNSLAQKPVQEAPGLRWMVSSPETVKHYATVPWYFGQMLQQETGIPIGIIKANWGGALPEHWMSPDSMKEVPELAGLYTGFSQKLKAYEENLPKNMKLLEDWVRAAEEAKSKGLDIPSIPWVRDLNPVYAPPDNLGYFCMYNGMISYLTHLPIKGVTWYQGESSQLDGPLYYYKMLALINGWRKVWNDPDLPFYFVQLPNTAGASGLPDFNPIGIWYFREVQAKCLQIPNTGMAVTIDVGEEDLHPRNKYDIGRRLARIALAKDYGKNIEYTAPVFKKSEIQNNKVTLTFDQLGAGLMVGHKDDLKPTEEDKGGKLQEFAIAGADKKWHWGEAVIDNNTVVVSSPEVPAPAAVRYAFTLNPAKCNLYGRNGLPVAPFRTDAW